MKWYSILLLESEMPFRWSYTVELKEHSERHSLSLCKKHPKFYLEPLRYNLQRSRDIYSCHRSPSTHTVFQLYILLDTFLMQGQQSFCIANLGKIDSTYEGKFGVLSSATMPTNPFPRHSSQMVRRVVIVKINGFAEAVIYIWCSAFAGSSQRASISSQQCILLVAYIVRPFYLHSTLSIFGYDCGTMNVW